jgi:hypothetical protein
MGVFFLLGWSEMQLWKGIWFGNGWFWDEGVSLVLNGRIVHIYRVYGLSKFHTKKPRLRNGVHRLYFFKSYFLHSVVYGLPGNPNNYFKSKIHHYFLRNSPNLYTRYI